MFKNFKSALKNPKLVHSMKLESKELLFPDEMQTLIYLQELHIKSEKVENYVVVFKLPLLKICKFIQTPLNNLSLPLGHISSPLKFLTLKDCKLSTLPEEIGMFSELEELNLSGNTLSELPYSMRDLKNLRRLNLDSNNFVNFPDLIKNLPRLHHLSIDNNNFSDEEKARVQREFNLTIN